jgi:hypothetical protein
MMGQFDELPGAKLARPWRERDSMAKVPRSEANGFLIRKSLKEPQATEAWRLAHGLCVNDLQHVMA